MPRLCCRTGSRGSRRRDGSEDDPAIRSAAVKKAQAQRIAISVISRMSRADFYLIDGKEVAKQPSRSLIVGSKHQYSRPADHFQRSTSFHKQRVLKVSPVL